MGTTAIRVEHLSKMYKLGVINNGTLWKDIQTWAALKMGKEDPHSRIGEDKYSGDEDHFWALKDVSFDIQQGDRVGIIGKNGAGKSTLLKLLSRVTAPTEGSIKIKGKISSLLEVGTGFNGELTGRENIYLNGAILGMKTRQIDRKIDEIIDFSGIEHHIDTPVKRYSSGMYVRLAFAVAAHLDSEILIADEVLAVGDADFQKKALKKMNSLSSSEGRTVLFVSHQMNAISGLCTSGIIMDKGRIVYQSNDIQDTIVRYLRSSQKQENKAIWNNENEFSNVNFTPMRMYVVKNSSTITDELTRADTDVFLVLEGVIKEINALLNIGVSITTSDGSLVFCSWLKDVLSDDSIKIGNNAFFIRLPVEMMNIGQYTASLSAGLHHVSFIIDPGSNIPSVKFSISGSIGTDYGDDTRAGAILPLIKWENRV